MCVLSKMSSPLTLDVAWRAAALSTALSWHAHHKKKLTPAGCAVAWLVGFLQSSCGMPLTVALLTFFLSSSYITKRGAETKRKIEKSYVASGGRSAWQVLCNGGFAACACGLALAGVIPLDRALFLSVVAHVAACQGDTWSSELGVLSPGKPRLIVGFREVPKGTNGAVSVRGTAAAVGGGLALGLAVSAAGVAFPGGLYDASIGEVIAVATAASLGGSLFDSVLGQFLQQSSVSTSGHICSGEEADTKPTTIITGLNVLSNNAVNGITAVAATLVTYWCLQMA